MKQIIHQSKKALKMNNVFGFKGVLVRHIYDIGKNCET